MLIQKTCNRHTIQNNRNRNKIQRRKIHDLNAGLPQNPPLIWGERIIRGHVKPEEFPNPKYVPGLVTSTPTAKAKPKEPKVPEVPVTPAAENPASMPRFSIADIPQ